MHTRLFAAFVSLLMTLLFVLPLRSAPLDMPLSAEPQQASVPEVFGGREAQPGAWTWQAAIVRASQTDAFLGQYCGGTLIAPQWVLTAAHCVDGLEPSGVDVVLGRHNLSSDEGERIASAQLIVHPNFNYNSLTLIFDLDFDIALIRLATPSSQEPVALFDGLAGEEESQFIGGTVTGWGLTDQLSYPDALHEVVVPFVSPESCIQSYGTLVTENMICAGYPKGNKDSCYGDSGGPLVVHSQDEDEEGWQQVGIVSWGRYCGTAGAPGVYTRVASHTEWIDECLTNHNSHICTGSDIYEPDDQPQQATLIQTRGISQTHHFHKQSDRDWVKFEAKIGKVYRIEVQPQGTQSDPLLWLYAADGLSPLAYDDDSGNSRGAQLLWRAEADATLFVEVQDGANAKGNGTAYAVLIQEVVPIYLPIVERTSQWIIDVEPIEAPAVPVVPVAP